MIEIFHVSDLHLGRDAYREICVRRLLRNLTGRFDFPPDGNRYLLVTGDITNGGRDAEYFLALKVLMPFRNRVFFVPGNHDYGGLSGNHYSEGSARSFDSPFAECLGIHHPYFDKHPFASVLEDKTDGTKVALIGLNSCKHEGLLDFSRGEIGASQRAEMGNIMNNYQNLPKIVYLHHIPHKDAAWPAVMTLQDRKELMAILEGRFAVLAFGHQGGTLEDPSNADSTFRATPKRSMTILAEKVTGKVGSYILDADNSVDDQACYRITVQGYNVKVALEKFPPLSPEPLAAGGDA
jgi:hypothetical protein